MSLSVDYLYFFSKRLIRKNQSGGLLSKTFENLWNDSQGSYMDDLVGRFQLRNVGKTGPETGMLLNETILQKLSPFITPGTLTIDNTGKALKPAGFIYRIGMRINGFDCVKINNNQIPSVTNSVIDPPSVVNNKYYYVEYLNYYQFLAPFASTASLDYVITPPDIVWGYTFDSKGRQVYNSGLSVQPLWDNNSCREITKRMLVTLGVSFKDNDFVNFGKSVQLTGE